MMLAGSAAAAAADATHDGPLIAYAVELNKTESTSDVRGLHNATTALRSVTFELSRHPPPRGEDCAQTLGASRFAQQYAELASIQDQLGNFEAVIEANRSALACMPRVASYEASIASAYISLDHIDEARAAVERGYALNPEDRNVRDVRARLDFIQERWADATARFRLQVLEEKFTGSQLADYERCYLWLAQRRAGVRNPEIPEATPLDSKEPEETRPKRWPTPILETLRGKMSEASLAQTIRDEASESARREWLTEALYYVGELRLAEGDAETARRHFAAVVNLRVLNFVEYGMARAELKKMRDRAPVADAATSEAALRLH
jgi:tetratricopeptide (TPR) repeat protein